MCVCVCVCFNFLLQSPILYDIKFVSWNFLQEVIVSLFYGSSKIFMDIISEKVSYIFRSRGHEKA